MGPATSQIELATSVVPIQTRHPVAMAQQVLTTQIACGGRVALGIGPSHHWVVEDQLGLSYDRPAHLVRSYLEVLSAALAGPGTRRRRERAVPRPQPDERHRHRADADSARGARAGDAAARR